MLPFTSLFIHYGILHFIINLFGLGVALAMLERVIGDCRLIFAIFPCAIIDAYVSIYWAEFSVIAGTSGAIYGLFGIIFVFYLYRNLIFLIINRSITRHLNRLKIEFIQKKASFRQILLFLTEKMKFSHYFD